MGICVPSLHFPKRSMLATSSAFTIRPPLNITEKRLITIMWDPRKRFASPCNYLHVYFHRSSANALTCLLEFTLENHFYMFFCLKTSTPTSYRWNMMEPSEFNHPQQQSWGCNVLANVGFLGHNIGLLMLQCYSFNSKHSGKLHIYLPRVKTTSPIHDLWTKKSVALNNIVDHTWDNILYVCIHKQTNTVPNLPVEFSPFGGCFHSLRQMDYDRQDCCLANLEHFTTY